MLDNVSIIIPVALNETAHEILLKDLESCGAEIIVSSEGSRAASLNVGAEKAGISICVMPSKLRSSARKYREVGWLKLTLIRQWQFWRLMCQKL